MSRMYHILGYIGWIWLGVCLLAFIVGLMYQRSRRHRDVPNEVKSTDEKQP